jgi:long-chain acyl-CoA synthetase
MDLGLDSLDKITLQVFVQYTFGVNLREDDLSQAGTVEKLADFIRQRKTKEQIEAINWAEILNETTNLNLPKSWFTYNILKNFARIILRIYFRFKTEGAENIPAGPIILAPNHQSFFDGLFVAASLKNKIFKSTYFYAKEKHVRNGWVKFIANRHNVVVMDINKDLKSSLQKMAEILRKGKNIIIFPEGTRTRDGRLGDFKKTFAILSRELNVPVIPVAIKGAFEALPKGSRFPRPFKKINIKFYQPVYPQNHSYDSLKEFVYEKVASFVQ